MESKLLEILVFTAVGIGLYLAADQALLWIERRRGARLPHRELAFLAIILVLALAVFGLIRRLAGGG